MLHGKLSSVHDLFIMGGAPIVIMFSFFVIVFLSLFKQLFGWPSALNFNPWWENPHVPYSDNYLQALIFTDYFSNVLNNIYIRRRSTTYPKVTSSEAIAFEQSRYFPFKLVRFCMPAFESCCRIIAYFYLTWCYLIVFLLMLINFLASGRIDLISNSCKIILLIIFRFGRLSTFFDCANRNLNFIANSPDF